MMNYIETVKIMKKKTFPKIKAVIEKCIEYAKLFGLWLKVSTVNLIEFVKVVCKYYTNTSFMKTDLLLLSKYVLKSPFRISKQFLMKKGEKDVYAYGETPLTTLESIAKQCGITKKDHVFELGCGRARTCFWLHHFVKCRVTGIDFVPDFITKAKEVQNFYKLNDIEFKNEDMLSANLSGASVVYLYGTCLSDKEIEQLVNKIEKLPSGTKIITVSYPLTDFIQKPYLELMKLFPAQFTWGQGDVYLHIRK